MNRIRKLREEFGYTQQDLANRLDSSKGVIGLYESETRKPSLEVLVKLSEIFNCSIDYLLGKSDIRNPEKIDENKLNVAFSSGFNGLNDTNKEIAQNIIAGLLAKQKNEEEKK